LVLLALPHVHTSKVRSMQFRPLSKLMFWFFVSDFIILTIVGGQPVEEPWVIVGQIASVAYFGYFLIITPLLGLLENKLLKL
jgi:ubiquinol-cytochrome c reductase cytochrome b subunit